MSECILHRDGSGFNAADPLRHPPRTPSIQGGRARLCHSPALRIPLDLSALPAAWRASRQHCEVQRSDRFSEAAGRAMR